MILLPEDTLSSALLSVVPRAPNSRVWAFTGPYTAPGSASGGVT